MTFAEIAQQAREIGERIARILRENAEARKELFERTHNRTAKFLGNSTEEEDE